MYTKLLALAAAGCVLLIAVYMRHGDQHTTGSCFVVTDGHKAVSYDPRAMKCRTVFFDAVGEQRQIRIQNPAPRDQYLMVYSQTTGESHIIHNDGVLLHNHYTISCYHRDGNKFAQTKLNILRGNAI